MGKESLTHNAIVGEAIPETPEAASFTVRPMVFGSRVVARQRDTKSRRGDVCRLPRVSRNSVRHLVVNAGVCQAQPTVKRPRRVRSWVIGAQGGHTITAIIVVVFHHFLSLGNNMFNPLFPFSACGEPSPSLLLLWDSKSVG